MLLRLTAPEGRDGGRTHLCQPRGGGGVGIVWGHLGKGTVCRPLANGALHQAPCGGGVGVQGGFAGQQSYGLRAALLPDIVIAATGELPEADGH
jgi:hypothetical protein